MVMNEPSSLEYETLTVERLPAWRIKQIATAWLEQPIDSPFGGGAVARRVKMVAVAKSIGWTEAIFNEELRRMENEVDTSLMRSVREPGWPGWSAVCPAAEALLTLKIQSIRASE
jgi:hypothetical protein